MMTYFLLFWEFFKIGLFSFGGGMATVPFLYEIAEKYDWFDKSLIVDMIAVAESTPGPIGVNMATFAGYKAAGIAGSIISTFSLALPSLILAIIVAKILDKFKDNKYLNEIISGMKAAVIGLIIAIFIDILKISLFSERNFSFYNIDIKFIFVFLFLLFLIDKKEINIIIYFILSGLIGFLISFVKF